jgi:hypothetical protein
MIFSDNSVKLARTVIRVPEVEKSSKESLAEVKATPWDLHRPRQPEVVFKEKADGDHNEFAEKAHSARQVYLRADDFEQYGLTRGCPKCDNDLRNNASGTRPHSAVCRSRITAELAKTEAGRVRIGMAESRLDKTVEQLGQEGRDDRPRGRRRQMLWCRINLNR